MLDSHNLVKLQENTFFLYFFLTITLTNMPLMVAQLAFKDLMIHRHLQFTLLITFRCVLHRCMSLEIRR